MESLLSYRTWPDYWQRGRELTDRAIDMSLYSLACNTKEELK